MRTAAVWTSTSKASLLALVVPTAALGQEAAATSARYLEEIIVTAQKWEQSANTGHVHHRGDRQGASGTFTHVGVFSPLSKHANSRSLT
jgi:hypothetical protein